MITPQLISYINEQLAAGISQSTIRETLLPNGWTDADLSEAFASLTPQAVAPSKPHPTPERLKSGKVPLAITVAAVVFAYALYQNFGGGATQTALNTTVPPISVPTSGAIAVQNDQSQSAPPTPPAQTSGSSAASPTSAPSMPKTKTGQYTDGSFTGSPFDAYYGTVQVQAVVSGGKITDVKFIQYPNDRSNSRYINGQAMPLLTQEAVQAQSAQVDGVSGATFTSQAFQQSLASALALAK